jgi:hypothetical protein
MSEPVRVLSLPNGLSVSIYKHSRRYFGDYFRIKVEIVCNIPLRAEYFPENGAFVEACVKFGDEVVYTRSEEKMGVPSADVERTQEQLMTNFLAHSLPYISSLQFPVKAVSTEMKKTAGKGQGSHDSEPSCVK